MFAPCSAPLQIASLPLPDWRAQASRAMMH
jgi:hypothetical protein